MARRRLKTLEEQNQTSMKLNFHALKYLPRFFREVKESNPALFYFNIFLRVIASALPIAMLYLGKLIIDNVVDLMNTDRIANFENLWKWVILELILVVISDVLNRIISITEGLIGDQYSIRSSVLLINKTAEVEMYQLEDPEFYDKLERARQQTTGRVSLLSSMLTQGQDLITIIQYITALIYFEPWLILIVILSVIPTFINDLKFSSQSYSLSRSWTAERRELDYLRYIGANDKTAKELKLFGLAKFIADRFANLSYRYYKLNRKLAINRGILGSVFTTLGTLAYYGAYVLIILRVVSKVLTIGDLTFLAGSFNRLKSKLSASFKNFTRITSAALNLKDYFEFIDLKAIVDTSFEIRPLPGKIKEGLTIENLHFTYPENETEVIGGVSFTLKVGEKLAFVGENGAGKTTLIKLILRFYEPTQGRILLDGVDIRHYDKAEFQSLFGVIFQDFVRYEFTVGENISVGNVAEIENLALIDQAAELSLAKPLIKNFEDGYNQQLGKRFNKGVELSGGQWQKVALARAYMKDAHLMILDEPTSALDARAEYEAFQRFIGLTKGKTSIIISHRFSTVRMADRILVLKDGRILEIGSHEELMAHPRLYAELFNLQAEGYK
jgi:ATP-binding cassette subfamily B protein